jgi:hypothetical protein
VGHKSKRFAPCSCEGVAALIVKALATSGNVIEWREKNGKRERFAQAG